MDMPYTLVLHLGASSGAPWWNMWDPKIIGDMDAAAKRQIPPVSSDPRLLGYYTDNELGWWNGPLFEMTLEQAEASEQRRRLIKILHDDYGNSWVRLLRDFIPEGASTSLSLPKRESSTFVREPPALLRLNVLHRWLQSGTTAWFIRLYGNTIVGD